MLYKVYGAASVFIFPSLILLSYTYDPKVIVLVGFGTIHFIAFITLVD
jgi:hypothetical protein